MRRFTLQLPVTVTAKSGERLEATAESRDVSSHGICFYCDAALEPESAIEFTLTLPTEITMTEPLQVRCSGQVVRVENSSGSGKFAVAAAIDNYEFVADDADAGTAYAHARLTQRPQCDSMAHGQKAGAAAGICAGRHAARRRGRMRSVKSSPATPACAAGAFLQRREPRC